MRALFFRVRRRRYRVTLEETQVMHKRAWVMEREGSYSAGEGQHRARHCRVAAPTAEGLAELLEIATLIGAWE